MTIVVPQVGDIVYFNGGSPRLTVIEVREYFIKVGWFVFGSSEYKETVLPIQAVKFKDQGE